MIQYITFVQNPSFGSRDRVQTSFFWSKFDKQKSGVILKRRSRPPKSYHFFPKAHWCFCVSLVKIHQLVQEIECRQGSFLQSLYCGDLQNYQNLINSFHYPNGTIHKVHQNPSFGSRDRVQTHFFGQNLTFKVLV